jgi:hypothetical protein
MTDTTTPTVNNGRFTAGNPGRPAGSRNKANALIQAINDTDPEALKTIAEKVITKAKEGTPWAVELLFSRLWPEPKPRDPMVSFELPPLDKLDDVKGAIDAVLQAVAAGQISIAEGQAMCSMISDFARPVLELAEAVVEARVVEGDA